MGFFFAIGLCTVGWWSSHRSCGVTAITAAAMICFFAAIVSLVPLWKAGRPNAKKVVILRLVGTFLRTLLTVSMLLAALSFKLVPAEQKFVFGFWTIGFYSEIGRASCRERV